MGFILLYAIIHLCTLCTEDRMILLGGHHEIKRKKSI